MIKAFREKCRLHECLKTGMVSEVSIATLIGRLQNMFFSNSEKSTFQARILYLSKPLTRQEANRVSIREGQRSQLVRAGHGGFCLTLSSTVFHWLWF